MKITKRQLRKIIREEKTKLAEIGGPSAAVDFYRDKARLLMSAAKHLKQALGDIEDAVWHEESSAVGEDPDLQSAAMDIHAAIEFVEGQLDAVQAMVDMGS